MSSVVMAQCLISFGSNLGDRRALIAESANLIANSPIVHQLRTSRLFETPPIGGPSGQSPFLNAVAAFDTPASAREVLELLQQTEQHLGRQRRERWDARSIDLDVVLHGQLVGGGTGLIVPHPRYTARLFVLQPACDVASHFRDPRFGWTLAELTKHLRQGPPSLALAGGDVATRIAICDRLEAEFGIQTIAEPPMVEPMAILGNAPAPVARSAASAAIPESMPPAKTIDEDAPWVAAFVPPLLNRADDGGVAEAERAAAPRLIARLQRATAETRWPAPHQIWPSGWNWPEYRLEIDDLRWAAGEVASALDSMRCPVRPVTDDGNWW